MDIVINVSLNPLFLICCRLPTIWQNPKQPNIKQNSVKKVNIIKYMLSPLFT